MQIIEMPIDEIIPYANNPRNNDDAVDKVAASIAEFGFKVPVILDSNNVIVAGHTRVRAAKKLKLDTVPVIMADDLTEAQVKAFRLADNKVSEFATWDMEKLDLELADLDDINMTEFGFEDFTAGRSDGLSAEWDEDGGTAGNLVDKFGVPPFSVLDTRQGYWQDRKKAWLDKTGYLSETRDGEYGTIGYIFNRINGGTSNFDPVLAEIMYRWFCPKNGKILDPFGGEQTKGVVAGELGYGYTAVEFRQEQVDLNTEKTAQYDGVTYTCGDSNNISKLITERGFDMCFTSPPYYDLEVYSAEDMSALGTYEEFMAQYENIFSQCYDMLDDDTFLVIKIAEIRDKKTGEYRSFVADNIDMFRRIGFKYYNEIILVNAVGTAMLRVNRSMKNRKVGKVHQNVLVFYKGDLDNIPKKFEQLDFSEYEQEAEGAEDTDDEELIEWN